MAVTLQVREQFATATGSKPSELERQIREVVEKGLAPGGERGRRMLSAHWLSDHLAHGMFSFAATRPGAVERAIRDLDALEYRGSENMPDGMSRPASRLGLQVVDMLEGLGVPFSKGEQLDPESLAYVRTWELVMCLNPLAAQIMVGSDENRTIHYFAAPPPPDPGLRRLTILSGEVWLAAGALLADSIMQNNAIAMVQFLDRTKPAKASQENENAGSLRQEVPAPSTDDPRANGDEAYSLPNSLDRSASNGSSDQFATCEAGGFRNHREGICEVKSLQGCTQRELVAL